VDGKVCRAKVTNKGTAPVRIQEIVLFDIVHGWTDGHRSTARASKCYPKRMALLRNRKMSAHTQTAGITNCVNPQDFEPFMEC
jgi:hypothetical protein